MAEAQKLCGIKLGKQDASIRVQLARKLAAGEQVRFTLTLMDPSRNEALVALAEATLAAGNDQAELAVQSVDQGLALAYTADGFAKVQLDWKESVSGPIDATAQLAIAGKPYAFPQQRFGLNPPPPPPPPPPLPPPPPPPPPITWMLGMDRLAFGS